MYTLEDYKNSADFISGRLNGFKPEILIILGSGLGFLEDMAKDAVYIDYSEIPNFKSSTAIGHRGRFAAGMLAGKRVLMMQGRLHAYEGYTAEEIAYPVRVAKLLGAESMIITNAAGGVNADFKAGDLMMITDYIKFQFLNPLTGPNIDEFGPRFCDMSSVFDREYCKVLRETADELGETLKEGVYFYMTGPQYETPAEIRAIRILGGDAVGMSTVHECIAANHTGMRILGITLISNIAAGMLDRPLSSEEVMEAGEAAKERFSKLILGFIERI